MIKILIPDRHQPERAYALKSVLRCLPESDYNLEVQSEPNYIFLLPGEKKLIIEDRFFGLYAEKQGYLSESNIPKTIDYMSNKYTPEPQMPVLYGGTSVKYEDNTIYCDADIFASAFFMLTRWEEVVIKKKDKHERIIEEEQLSVKHNFFLRPIVDEYVRFFNNMLRELGVETTEVSKYQLVITHDIDSFRRYDTVLKFIRALGGDLLLRKSMKKFFDTIREYILIKLGKRKDPYDVFDFFMNVSEKLKLKSHFYFIPGYKGEADVRYNINDSAVIGLIKNIKDRGHTIGLHASYRAYNESTYFRRELERLKKITGTDIIEGRQHFLRFSNPITWRLWNMNNLRTDSTMGFYNHVGFRAGTAKEYPIFDILERKTLALYERPLIAMEVALKRMHPDYSDGLAELNKLKEKIQKYGGKFVLLWHNDKLNMHEWMDYSDNYKAITDSLAN